VSSKTQDAETKEATQFRHPQCYAGTHDSSHPSSRVAIDIYTLYGDRKSLPRGKHDSPAQPNEWLPKFELQEAMLQRLFDRLDALENTLTSAIEHAEANFSSLKNNVAELEASTCGPSTVYYPQLCLFRDLATRFYYEAKTEYQEQSQLLKAMRLRLTQAITLLTQIIATTKGALSSAASRDTLTESFCTAHYDYFNMLTSIFYMDLRCIRYLRIDPRIRKAELTKDFFYPMATTSPILSKLPTFGITRALILTGMAPVYQMHDYLQGRAEVASIPPKSTRPDLHPLANIRMYAWADLMDTNKDPILGRAVRVLLCRGPAKYTPEMQPIEDVRALDDNLKREMEFDPLAKYFYAAVLARDQVEGREAPDPGTVLDCLTLAREFYCASAQVIPTSNGRVVGLSKAEDLCARGMIGAKFIQAEETYSQLRTHLSQDDLQNVLHACDYRHWAAIPRAISTFMTSCSVEAKGSSESFVATVQADGLSMEELAWRLWYAAVQGTLPELLWWAACLGSAPIEQHYWYQYVALCHFHGDILAMKHSKLTMKYGVESQEYLRSLFGPRVSVPEALAHLHPLVKNIAHPPSLTLDYSGLGLDIAACVSNCLINFSVPDRLPWTMTNEANIKDRRIIDFLARGEAGEFAIGLALERGLVTLKQVTFAYSIPEDLSLPIEIKCLSAAAYAYANAIVLDSDSRAKYRLGVMYSRLAYDVPEEQRLEICKKYLFSDASLNLCAEWQIVSSILGQCASVELWKATITKNRMSNFFSNTETIPFAGVPEHYRAACSTATGLAAMLEPNSLAAYSALLAMEEQLINRIHELCCRVNLPDWPTRAGPSEYKDKWWDSPPSELTKQFVPLSESDAIARLTKIAAMQHDPYLTQEEHEQRINSGPLGGLGLGRPSCTHPRTEVTFPYFSFAFQELQTHLLNMVVRTPANTRSHPVYTNVVAPLISKINKLSRADRYSLVKSYRDFVAEEFGDTRALTPGWLPLESTKVFGYSEAPTTVINPEGVDTIVKAQLDVVEHLRLAPLQFVLARRAAKRRLSYPEELQILELGILAGCKDAEREHYLIRKAWLRETLLARHTGQTGQQVSRHITLDAFDKSLRIEELFLEGFTPKGPQPLADVDTKTLASYAHQLIQEGRAKYPNTGIEHDLTRILKAID